MTIRATGDTVLSTPDGIFGGEATASSTCTPAVEPVLPTPTSGRTECPSVVSPMAGIVAAEQLVIELTNAERLAAGVAALRTEAALMDIARVRATDMAVRRYLGHLDPLTGEYMARKMMAARGYTANYRGENWYGGAAAPPAIADEAMRWFMADAPHARNIISPHYSAMGAGIAFNGELWVVVQVFAGE